MIFARRALQRRLDELRASLGDGAVDGIVARLNGPAEHRLAAVWETVVLQALSKHGSLRHETPLPSGKRPDVDFAASDLSFVADITAPSDRNLHQENPYQEFRGLIEQMQKRLKLPSGGIDVHVFNEPSTHGTRKALRLPDRRVLPDFVKTEIEPEMRAQLRADAAMLCVERDDARAGFRVRIDPRGSRYSTGRHVSYDMPTTKDQNPLYKALKKKADKLHGAQGLKGIIVCDADSAVLAGRQAGWNEISAQAIIQEFLCRRSSISFVLLLSIREERISAKPTRRGIHPLLVVRKGLNSADLLDRYFRAMVGDMPIPVETPVNAAYQARSPGYRLGHHGGHTMSGSRDVMRIKFSARELMELLAGRRTIEQVNDLHGWLSPKGPNAPARQENPFELLLREGRLPTAISLTKTDEDDSDDWVEFQIGAPDPAITPFR